MFYTSNNHITSLKDVEAFFHHLVAERKLSFHPDDDFADYICIDGKTLPFSNDEVSLYNRLMDETFSVCDAESVDIFEIGSNELYNALGTKTTKNG